MTLIPIKACDTATERFTEVQESYVELHNDYIRRVIICSASVPKDATDLKGPWEDDDFYIDKTLLRKYAGAVSICLHTNVVWRYSVNIKFSSLATDINIIFRRLDHAQQFSDIMRDWILGK